MPKTKTIRANKVIHPNGRAAAQMARQAHHERKIENHHKNKCAKYDILGNKLLWFQENLDLEKTTYTKADCCELIERYIERFSDELEQIKMKNSMKGRDGQQHASRVQAINLTRERETKEYNTTGIEIPDLINGKAFRYFSEWSGEMRYLPNIKLKKIKSSDAQPKEEVEQMTEEKEDNALTKEDNSMQADTGDNNSVQEDNAA